MKHNLRQLLVKSLEKVSEDHKFVRLCAISTMSHTLIMLGMAIYYANAVLQYYNTGVDNGNFFSYVLGLTSQPSIVGTMVALGIVLGVGYSIIYPIGEAAILYYCKDDLRNSSKALGRGVRKFFPMFEFNAMRGVGLNVISYFFIVSRLFVMELLQMQVVQILVLLWLLVIIVLDILLPYTELIIVDQDKSVWEALSKSISLSFENLGITVKSVFLKFVLYLRFGLNTVVVLGIPTGMLWAAFEIGILDAVATEWVVGVTAVSLMLVMAYINGIFEGFFTHYRWQVYSNITHEEETNGTPKTDAADIKTGDTNI